MWARESPDRVKAGYRASYGIVFALAAVICLAVQLLARPLVSLFMEEGWVLRGL